MRNDFFTKLILSIIAILVAVIAVRSFADHARTATVVVPTETKTEALQSPLKRKSALRPPIPDSAQQQSPSPNPHIAEAPVRALTSGDDELNRIGAEPDYAKRKKEEDAWAERQYRAIAAKSLADHHNRMAADTEERAKILEQMHAEDAKELVARPEK